MKIAHLDCATGISGDMTLAALLDAGVSEPALRQAVDSLRLPDVRLRVEPVVKQGFRALQVHVEHPPQHAHRHLSDIAEIVHRADAVSSNQKSLAMSIFEAIAHAEARVHGMTVDDVHFHEVGAVDSIVDIVGAAVGFDLLGADRVTCSHIPTGRGEIRIAHGICAVPPPATAELLKGIPLRDVPVDGELTTPTGAAIVKSVVDSFCDLPAMTIDSVGYGAGSMNLPGRANVLRIFCGTSVAAGDTDEVVLLETNLDDVSGEIVGHATNQLFAGGALDVFTTPIQMKKNRPGILLEKIVFEETGTLGVRRHVLQRSVRQREECEVTTPWGPVRGKRGWRDGWRPTFSPEFADAARVAGEHGVPLREVCRAAESAYQQIEESGKIPHQSQSSGTDHDHAVTDHDQQSSQDGHRHDHDTHHHDHDTHRHDHG